MESVTSKSHVRCARAILSALVALDDSAAICSLFQELSKVVLELVGNNRGTESDTFRALNLLFD